MTLAAKHITPLDAPRVRVEDSDRLLLRPGEVATRLGISRTVVYELIASGEIPSIRIGSGKRRSVRVPVEDLRDWIAAQVATRAIEGR